LESTSSDLGVGSFFTRPICLILMAMSIISVAIPIVRGIKDKKAGKEVVN